MIILRSITLLLAFLWLHDTVAAQERAITPSRFDEPLVGKFWKQHCLACHGPDMAKGEFRIDQLSTNFADARNRDRWDAAIQRIQAGEMPPKGKPRPARNEIDSLHQWYQGQVASTEKANGRVALRRLNRIEYENTVRDLLGIDVDLQEMLPPDSSANGFDNNSEAQHISSFLLDQYLEAAEVALNIAIANGPRPPLIQKRYDCKNQHQVKSTTEKVFRPLDDGLVFFSSSAWQAVTLWEFYPPDRGRYRFRISASGFQSDDKPVTFRVDAGLMLMSGKTHLVGYFDAPPNRPQIVEFVDHLGPRHTIRILPYGLASAQAVHKIGAADYTGAGLAVQWVEVEGPLHEVWPPVSHRSIFGELPQAPAPVFNQRNRVEVVSKNPDADLPRILRPFAERAFRGPVSAAELQPFLKLVKAKLDEGHSFEQATRVGLKAIMVSPRFLFLREEPGKLDDHALASRLSYFLWSTMPDDELLELARLKKLSEPTILREQVERLLRSPKAKAFTEQFVGQWLGLRDIDFTEPSHILYPEYDHMLKVSMVRETELFFAEVLKNDLSLTHFVSSDFSMLNGRLAKHYGIPGIDGWEFRKVSLPKESHRGGVMTMASVLKVTANGTSTSPVLRGAWVNDRILGTPAPKPPPDVPAVEPDIRGATTIREQLAKHRQLESCASCHAKIDPPGFALENFDVIGGWREHYRTSGRGQPVTIDGRRMPYLHGPKIDPSDALLDGSRFQNIDELKELLLRDKDQIARSLTEKLVTYATGAAPRASDRAEVDAIIARIRAKGYGTRTLIHEIVQSRIFQAK